MTKKEIRKLNSQIEKESKHLKAIQKYLSALEIVKEGALLAEMLVNSAIPNDDAYSHKMSLRTMYGDTQLMITDTEEQKTLITERLYELLKAKEGTNEEV